MSNPAYPNGRCYNCGWGVNDDGTCPNEECQEYGSIVGEPSADYLRKDAIHEIMLVATFDTVEEQRDALNAAYSAGYHDAREHSDDSP